MDDYSDLYEKEPHRLGLEGYCFVASEILYEFFPKSSIYRLTKGDDFGHVFIEKEGCYFDIRGKVTISDLKVGYEDYRIEKTTIKEIQKYFYSFTESEERRHAKIILKEYIKQNEQKWV